MPSELWRIVLEIKYIRKLVAYLVPFTLISIVFMVIILSIMTYDRYNRGAQIEFFWIKLGEINNHTNNNNGEAHSYEDVFRLYFWINVLRLKYPSLDQCEKDVKDTFESMGLKGIAQGDPLIWARNEIGLITANCINSMMGENFFVYVQGVSYSEDNNRILVDQFEKIILR
jgi:hypothetical protein